MTQREGLCSISGAQLKFHRLAKGWTIGQLADRSGVAKSTISRLETGKRGGVSARTWQALARALGVRPEDIADMERLPLPVIVSADQLPSLETFLEIKYGIHLHTDKAREFLTLLVALSKILDTDEAAAAIRDLAKKERSE